MNRFARCYVLLCGAGLLTLVAVGLMGLWPTQRLAGSAGVMAMLAGCAVSWLASCIGAIPVARVASGRAAGQMAQSILASTAIRFVVVLFLVVPVALSGVVNRNVFVIWVGVSYLALLLADTLLSVRMMNLRSSRGSGV